MTAKELSQLLKNRTAPCIIDVRTGLEFNAGHISGATNATTLQIPFKKASFPKDKSELILLVCEHGPRAQMAKAVLSLLGYSNVDLLEGHMSKWRSAGFPVE